MTNALFSRSTVACLAGAALLGTALFACQEDEGYYANAVPYGPYLGPDSGASGITGDGAASASPILAKVDPNATMVQTPGQGVGVFTQYVPTSDASPGGHWYVWWTCDTSLSNQNCPFAITVSVASGAIQNAVPQNFLAGDTLSTGAGVEAGTAGSSVDGGVEGGSVEAGTASSSITADTTTTTTVQGIHFDTAPGAVITLSAALGGEYSGSFLFFVQDGKVNGGYTGTVSDPLELQSSVP
jgi:hypothetical protein